MSININHIIGNQMQSFKDYLSESKRIQLITEGGNAVKSASRINQLNVKATLSEIYKTILPKLKLKKADITLLGSTGKKDPKKNGTEEGSSGDIDLGISLDALMKANNLVDEDAVYAFIEDACKDQHEVHVFKGLEVVSIAFPIVNTDGKQDGEHCQLDLMPVHDLAYAAWSYHSPAYNESKYKGLYPKEVYYACARVADTKTTETAKQDGKDVPIEWTRMFFDLNKGLMVGKQSIKGKTKAIVKGAKTSDKSVKTADPKKIVKILFGSKFKPTDVLTWEQVWKAINSKDFVHKDKLPEILKIVKKGIERKGVPLPSDLIN